MNYCRYCDDEVDLELWIQRMYPNVCDRCLIDGTHKDRPKVSLAQILREDALRAKSPFTTFLKPKEAEP